MSYRAKMIRHRESLANRKPVLFCCRCGSTNLDQNSISELRCYDCDNKTPWDGTKFSVRRWLDSHGEGDVINGFQCADKVRLSRAERLEALS